MSVPSTGNRRRLARAFGSALDTFILPPSEIAYDQTTGRFRMGNGSTVGGLIMLTEQDRGTYVTDRPFGAVDNSVIVDSLASARATGKMIRGIGTYNFGEGMLKYTDVRWRTIPADDTVDNTFGERLIINNPINNMTGYGARRVDYTSTGIINNGRNTIGHTLLFRMNDIRNGFSWNWWEVCMSPLHPASGLPGAPGGPQQFSMLIGEANPTNRYGDGGWRGETRLFTPCGVGGIQMVPETQDFTSLLGGQRIGYNIAFGIAFIKSPYAATNTKRHAQIYNHLLANPNSVAKGGYFAFGTGYYDTVIDVEVIIPGTGYKLGEMVEFAAGLDGNANEPSRMEVTGVNGAGGITAVRILSGGWYQQTFANPVGSVYGSGVGASFGYLLSSNTDRPQAFVGMAGQWEVGIDGAPPPNLSSNHGFATFGTAMIRAPRNSRILVARSNDNTADLELLRMLGDTVLLGGSTTGVQIGTGSSVLIEGPLTLSETVRSRNFTSDGAAATGGVPIGGVYHNAGALRIRLT